MKNFLEEISMDALKREAYVLSSTSFTRKRLVCFKTLVFLLLHTIKKSLTIELMFFYEHFAQSSACSKQAFSKARRKLSPLFFVDWNTILIESFYTHYKGNYALWKGFKLLAVDGSSVLLPETKENKDTYGYIPNAPGKKEAVMARIFVLYDVLNHLAIKGFLHPYKVSEEEVVLPALESENLRDSLLVFDRGYLSFWLMYMLLDSNTHFVIRAAGNANNVVKSFLQSTKKDMTSLFYPPYSSVKKLRQKGIEISKHTPIRIRLVKVELPSGQTEVLITNLYDTNLYSVKDLGEVYGLRWGIETYYGYLKEELQLANFSGISPICIEQDFASNLLLFNLQSVIEKQCEKTVKKISENRKYTYKVNKNISWASLKYRVIKLFVVRDPTDILLELERLFCKYLEPIRQGRKYPRVKKKKTNSKYYTLTNYKRAM